MKPFNNIHIKLIAFLLFVCLHLPNVLAQKNLQTRINASIASKDFKYASIGISVIDIASGKSLAGIYENKVLVPASSQKLITNFIALELLGSEYKFKTKIAYDGRVQADGTLEGNIYIIGQGDPTLGSDRINEVLSFDQLLEQIVNEIKNYGITCIDGKVIADESYFHSFPVSPSWQWNDLGNYYASGAWGLNVNENSYVLAFNNRSKVGLRPSLNYYAPKIPGIKFSNELSVDKAGTGDNAYIFGGPNNYYKRIIGTIPVGKGDFFIKGSIPDPPIFMAYHLMTKLSTSNISSEGYSSIFDPIESQKLNRSIIYEIGSPSLSEIIKCANQYSNNLYCESLLKTIAKVKGHEGSGSHGILEINRFLRKIKIDVLAVHLEDGSGLSARNNISAKAMALFLQKMTLKNDIEDLCKLMAVGGINGTVAGLFKGSSASGKVFLKSGSMNRVLSFSGYIKSKSGRWISFSIIVNGFHVENAVMRKKLEKIMINIYLYA